jgi:hypothetical protein
VILAAGAFIPRPEAGADTLEAEEAEAFRAFEDISVAKKAPLLAARTGIKSIFLHRNLPLRAKMLLGFSLSIQINIDRVLTKR